MDSIFDLDEVALSLAIQLVQIKERDIYGGERSVGMEKLIEYHFRYPRVQKVTSSPIGLQRLSEVLGIKYRNPHHPEIINITSFLDLVIANKYYNQQSGSQCVNQAVALSYALRSGDDTLVEKHAVIRYKGTAYPSEQPLEWHRAGRKVIDLAIRLNASDKSIEALANLYEPDQIIYSAAKLRRKDLMERYISDERLIGKRTRRRYFDVESG